ncbi:hypothetical protein RJ55_05501 [Drechmeria coniospora]|nr:hypothetical protein RJ55_05501 [Drechmeria coniospora]
MFSTFTGSSKRPRNVNLSGQAGNPFANTSWSPSVASNATKTVSDAQAEREKRQIERRRLKAAGKIQMVWRGHRTRTALAETRRAMFDDIYNSSSNASPDEVPLDQIIPANMHSCRLRRFVDILVQSLHEISTPGRDPLQDADILLKLLIQIISDSPTIVIKSIGQYFEALAQLSRSHEAGHWKELIATALTIPLHQESDDESCAYSALAFSFLAKNGLTQFEANIDLFSEAIDTGKLSMAIIADYDVKSGRAILSKDDLLWLLAHFIDLGHIRLNPSDKFAYLSAVFSQLSFLSADLSARSSIRSTSDVPSNDPDSSIATPFYPYVSHQLSSLVDHSGITKLLHDFSDSLAETINRELQRTSILAGYILALLQSFPGSADDTRMRLSLAQIPTTTGEIPTVKFLWQIMKQTSIFRKLQSESEKPTVMLRRYLHGSSRPFGETIEDQEWRIILLFLELYMFILRLSDDEDFFSGMSNQRFESSSAISQLRACSLSRADVDALTTALKNTAFSLHYKANEVARSHEEAELLTESRLKPYLGSDGSVDGAASATSARVDLDSLRSIITTTLRMLYERDSRMHFLSATHWLMTDKLEQEDFVNAVIAEEERQNQEAEDKDSDDEGSLSLDDYDVNPEFYSTVAAQRLSRNARLERLKAQQIRSQRDRRLAEMGPKLEILKHMPFVVPFETRVMIFRQFIHLDRVRRDGDNPFPMFPMHPSARHHARIRRGQLFDDAYEQFYQLGDGLKDPIQITFVDQFDAPEAGIDGGGVTKEFLTSVTSEAFGNERGGLGMFTPNEQGLLFPNPTIADTMRQSLRQRGLRDGDGEFGYAMANLFKRFEFLGRIVGKCMYEGILVDLAFAGFFLLKWPSAGTKGENACKGSINDLRDMDAELYNGMLRLKNYAGDLSDLGFDFTVEDQVSAPGQPVKTVTRKLIANGDLTPVTNDNRLLYISYMARHRLVVQPSLQTAAFLRGLHTMIKPSWLSMFNQSELQRLVGGDSSEIDINDLRHNTVYSGLYEIGDDREEHPTIKLFWKVMEGFTDAQRRDVLKYVSSTPRAPLLGFSQLRPKFSIRDGGTDEERLPSTSTCVNLLKLPRYTSEKALRDKLLYAVTSGAGFDLS